jgi:hypothetical protein
MSRFVLPLESTFNINGAPQDGAKLEFFNPGLLTNKDTYSDQALTTANTNPVIANASGRFGAIWMNGDYDVTLKDKNDVLIWGPERVLSNVTNDDAFKLNEATTATMAADTAKTYVVGDVVETKEFSTGNGGGGTYDCVTVGITANVDLPNGRNIIVSTVDNTKCYVLRVDGDVNVRAFGATGDGVTDDTASIQAAINYASNFNIYTIRFPSGEYASTTLYAFYHVTLNPGYATGGDNRHGKIKMQGEGALDIAFMRTYTPAFGSIINFGTSDGLIVSSVSEGHGVNPYPARKFQLRDMTLTSNSTTHVLEVASCPEIRIINSSILQRNAAGSGALIKSAWFGKIIDSIIMNDEATPTGIGLELGTDISAGLFDIRGSLIDGFQDNITWEAGSWDGLSIRDTAIQRADRYSIHTKAGDINQLNLKNVHFEGDSRTSDIFIAGSTVRALSVKDTFFLGGTTTTSYISGPVIDIDTVETVTLEDNHVFRGFSAFCSISAVSNGVTSGQANRNSFIHDNIAAVTPTIYLFDGVVPHLEDNIYTGASVGLHEASTFKLYDESGLPSVDVRDKITGTNSISKLAFGPVRVVTGASGTYATASNGNNVVYDITNTVASSLTLSNIATAIDGRAYLIKNNAASVGVLNVRNSSDSSLILSLAIGESSWFVFDKHGAAKYISI